MEVTIPVSDTPSFASTREALGMLYAVMGYLSADAGQMAADAQAECLQELERLDGVKTATRARVLGAFTAALAQRLRRADGNPFAVQERSRVAMTEPSGVRLASLLAADPRGFCERLLTLGRF